MILIQRLYLLFRLEGEQFIAELYRQLLNKEPEPHGIRHFTRLLQAGHSKLSIVVSFLRRSEMKKKLAQGGGGYNEHAALCYTFSSLMLTRGDSEFVRDVYVELLCRDAEDQALMHYQHMLRHGRSRMSVLLGILTSPECQALLAQPEFPRLNGPIELGSFHLSQGEEPGTKPPALPAPPLQRKVSIVILTWNGLEHTKRCLASLEKTARHDRIEIVVFDNGSTDGTLPYLQSIPWIRVIEHGANIGFTAGNNLAITLCDPGSDILMLNNDIVAEEPHWVERLQETAYSDPNIGVVGCRLRGDDGLVQHAGTYIFAETCWGQQIGGLETDIRQYASARDVQGVVFACAYVKRSILEELGGLDTDYFAYFEDTDYCLRALERGYRVVCDGRVTLTHSQNTTTKVNQVDFSGLFEQSRIIFRDKWQSRLEGSYEKRLNWHSIVNAPTGYATSSKNLMIALDEKRIKMHYRYVYGPGTPHAAEEPPMSDDYRINIFRMRHADPNAPEVVYGQGDVFFKNEGKYKIGYTMLEVDGVPEEWVHQCNRMDEIWVPSQFNAETFRNSGVRVPIRIMPLGVDPNYFHPGIRSARFSDRFTFLSVFEWGERKNPEDMLRTFANVFANDNVLLVCKIMNADPTINVLAEIRKLNLKHAESKILILYNQKLPSYLLGSLYRSADCFILPTRGEGWGMPILEAMACGLPVIATDWSAQRDFLNERTGYPIRVKQLVPAVAKCPYYANFRWADPDYDHLAFLMRHVYENREAARERGLNAAQEVISRWTWSHAAQHIADRIQLI
ncbi:glycosyltransferase [Paenibacillus thiaminolyticus]|uniref:DUF4214 domain-containing protein n=1 Tax=Paenibacillus TaxID=44249 RepID=UPI00387E104C